MPVIVTALTAWAVVADIEPGGVGRGVGVAVGDQPAAEPGDAPPHQLGVVARAGGVAVLGHGAQPGEQGYLTAGTPRLVIKQLQKVESTPRPNLSLVRFTTSASIL